MPRRIDNDRAEHYDGEKVLCQEPCAYCGSKAVVGMVYPGRFGAVERWWVQETLFHLPGCEWVRTRAHRKQMDFGPDGEAREVRLEWPVWVGWQADTIRALRQAMHLSQVAFAKRLGIHKGTVSRWETHQAFPSALAQKGLDLLKRSGYQKGK